MSANRRPYRTKASAGPSLLDRINPNAAGIDCGANTQYVAVAPNRDPMPVRAFQTFTADLHRVADWLTACGVTTVAMESTGVYWISALRDSRGPGARGHPCQDPGAAAYDAHHRLRVLRRLRQRAASLGFSLLNRETGELLDAPVS
jgi:hypothetical protein